MDRRDFIRTGTWMLMAGALAALVGCGRADEAATGMGNQEKLWNIVAGIEETEAPILLGYAEGTPASFRDASLGRIDSSFVPQTGGG